LRTKESTKGLEADATSQDYVELGRAVIDLIQSRRSVREGFKQQQIPPEVVDDIIHSGLTAPSSKNAQPWRIHVVSGRDSLDKIANLVQANKQADSFVPIDPETGVPREWSSTVAESAQILREISLGLFIENQAPFSGGRSTVIAAGEDFRPSAVEGYGFEIMGMGAMVENMWLTARAHRLEGVFMGDVLVSDDEINNILGIEGDLVGVLALGYTDQEPHPKILKSGAVIFHD